MRGSAEARMMRGNKRIALTLGTVVFLLAVMTALSNVSGQAGGEDISHPSAVKPPVEWNRDPKIQSAVSELLTVSKSQGTGVIQDFAARRGVDYKDGLVTLVVETTSERAATEFQAAINGAAPPAGISEAEFQTATGGVEVAASHGNLVQILVPPDRIDDLAALSFVSFVRLPLKPITFTFTSEGVADTGADNWHAGGIDGDGVKIAVTDIGFAGYQTQVAAGELPADVIVNSFSGDITGGGVTHGTGCAEIAYDMAPGAQFYLLNFSTDVELANMIDYIKSEGIDVVSASWAVPSNYQGNGDGAVDDLVKSAHDAGVFWANAAGNSAQNHWGGFYEDANLNGWHDFAAGDEGNGFTAQTGEFLAIYLTWNNWPVTNQDYDLYLYKDGIQEPVAVSGNLQTGTQAPHEEIYYVVPPGLAGSYHLAIANAGADGTADFQLFCHFGVLEHQVAARSITGQPADSAYVTTVGAVQVDTTSLMYYSSRGPTVDGRTKPDLAAPTNVSTLLTGSLGFGGTSGATPHVAGAAALLKEAKPAYTPDQIRSELEGWAEDLGVPGKDNDFGSGKLDLFTCARPSLEISLENPFWASYSDYVLRELSVTWSICNQSGNTAYDMRIVGSNNTNGVELSTDTPVVVGDIAGGGSCTSVTLAYQVPWEVTAFFSTTYATTSDYCGITYSYPE
jgi:hypothetical protein